MVKLSSYLEPQLSSSIKTKKGHWFWIGVVALTLLMAVAVGGIAAIISLYVIGRRFNEYAIVIDAGSSSSKVVLYSWPTFLSLPNAPVTQTSHLCKTQYGISYYENSAEDSANEILHCLQQKPFIDIPKQQVAYVNLYLGATAGMRMLNYSNFEATKQIYDNLRRQLSQIGYSVADSSQRIRTISGEEEAIAAWITVNYLKEKFGKKVNGIFQPSQSQPEDTFGSLDLGGASTQITFFTTANDSSFITLQQLFGQPYKVFAFSHLCYGKRQVEIRQLAMLIKATPNQLNIKNPCMAPGSNVTISSTDVFMAPCVHGKFAQDAFNESIDAPTINTVNYTFIGAGDHEVCATQYVKPLFDVPIIKRAKLPPIRGKFIAFAAFYAVLDSLKLAPSTTLAKFNTAIADICKTAINSKDAYEPYYCFDGIYIRHLLQSYGFQEDHWNNIEFVNKIDDSDVSWSLGFMIDQSGHVIRDMPTFPNTIISSNLFIALLIFLLVSLMVFTGLVVFMLYVTRRRAKTSEVIY